MEVLLYFTAHEQTVVTVVVTTISQVHKLKWLYLMQCWSSVIETLDIYSRPKINCKLQPGLGNGAPVDTSYVLQVP